MQQCYLGLNCIGIYGIFTKSVPLPECHQAVNLQRLFYMMSGLQRVSQALVIQHFCLCECISMVVFLS